MVKDRDRVSVWVKCFFLGKRPLRWVRGLASPPGLNSHKLKSYKKEDLNLIFYNLVGMYMTYLLRLVNSTLYNKMHIYGNKIPREDSSLNTFSNKHK